LDQGFEVYRNVSSHGLCDLIAEKDGRFRRFDVKSFNNLTQKTYPRLKSEQIKNGIELLVVKRDDTCVIVEESMYNFFEYTLQCKSCGVIFKRGKRKTYCSDQCRSNQLRLMHNNASSLIF
jgi:hypothetical protein